jgi:hypothetical protein
MALPEGIILGLLYLDQNRDVRLGELHEDIP